MLKKVVIRGLQKYRKKKIVFAPRVTTLVGPTGAGKSSFVRALSLLLTGQWREAYRRHGAEETSVEGWIDNKRVKRVKGKKTNVYVIGGKKLSAVGKTVPEEVARLVNVGPANFHRQHDALFWFSETAGQVSKNLNRIVNLEAIDNALAAAAAGVRRADLADKIAKDELAGAESDLKQIEWAEDFVAEGETVLLLAGEARLSRLKRAETAELVRGARKCRGEGKRAANALLRGKRMIKTHDRYRTAVVERERLHFFISKAREYKRAVKTAVPDMGPLLAIRQAGDDAAEERRHLEVAYAEAKAAAREALIIKMELFAAKDALAAAAKKQGKKRCPVCNQIVKS